MIRPHCRPVRALAILAATALPVLAMLAPSALAQPQPTDPTNGPKRVDPGWHAITNARIVTMNGPIIEGGTIVFRGDTVRFVGTGNAPAGARVWDGTGMTVYPGLIESYLEVEAPALEAGAAGTHWNDMIGAERSILDGAGIDEDTRAHLREHGFVVAHASPKDGILRGRTSVVALGEPNDSGDPLAHVITPSLFHAASIDLKRGGGYPGSKMGAIALLRQTLSDAIWYESAWAAHTSVPAKVDRPALNNTLETLVDHDAPIFFEVDDELDLLRVMKIAKEFNRPMHAIGSGSEYRRLAGIAQAGSEPHFTETRLVVPLAFPSKPDLATMSDREIVSLRRLQEWERGPANIALIEEAGAEPIITSSKLPEKQKFFDNLRTVASYENLDESSVLAMLTTRPAAMLGIDDRYGTIKPSGSASFVVVEGSLFDSDAVIRDVWIDGERYEINAKETTLLEGAWEVSVEGDAVGGLTFDSKNTPTWEPELGDDADDEESAETFKGKHAEVIGDRVEFILPGAAADMDGPLMVSAIVSDGGTGDSMFGRVESADGSIMSFKAMRQPDDGSTAEEPEEEADDPTPLPAAWGMPLGAFAFDGPPEQGRYIIQNATIWTCAEEPEILENASMLVEGGTITSIRAAGDAIPANWQDQRTITIDATGKHVSPGLIDCHSHTGISGGVNEGTQATTSEVRIADVINTDDINWYRQLAGGLTAANQLHGSANPIGGQNSVVKLRWGALMPDDMRIDTAIEGIKFALGENVKQSNWGAQFNTRYPQTRMGVEAIMRDRFITSREYAKSLVKWFDAPGNSPSDMNLPAGIAQSMRNAAGDVSNTPVPATMPRRDLELEAVAEILANDRLVHCHSYRQDEILMLCRIAGSFGFTIGTFQHVLEGYKVAEAIKEHSLGGSAFSDWWAFKFEVIDAIPYNGAIMHDVGVVVSFNSDSSELARRMNAEAAKAVKWGGVDPHEALKFVTLNPAKQLKIDDRVGSIEVGKDADFVIWSASPLSTRARAERTFVDGREYFSLQRDEELRSIAADERARLINELLGSQDEDDDAEPTSDEPETDDPNVDGPTSGGRRGVLAFRNDSIEDAIEREYRWLLDNGFDPGEMRCGDCGCSIHSLFAN